MSTITQVFDQVKDDAQDFANWMTSQSESLTLRNGDVVKTRHWLASQLNDPAAHYLKSEIDLNFPSNLDITSGLVGGNTVYHSGLDSGWLYPTLLNGYINGVEPISYRKSACGRVDIVGDYVHGGSLVNPSIFVLPAGFRSSKIVRVSTALDGFNKDGLIISTDGVVTPMFSGPGSTESVSCSFYADQ